MKIVFINTLYSPHIGGGAEITLKSLVDGLHSRGHDVYVVTTGPERGVKKETVDGVPVFRVGIVNSYWHHLSERPGRIARGIWHIRDIVNRKMAAQVADVVEEIGPDVVNLHNIVGISAAVWTEIRARGFPVGQVLHDLYNLCPNSNMYCKGRSCKERCPACSLFRLPHARLSNAVDGVVGVSEFVLNRHLKYGLFERAERGVIHNARTLPEIVRDKPAHQDGKIRFGFIGTLTPAKGIEILLESFEQLSPGFATELIVGGNGHLKYEQYLKRKYTKSIVFLGRTTPEEFYKEVDVLVVPSIWNDTLPGVVFESMSYGVPVIGSRRGGIPEMIQDGVNGFLFEPEKSGELFERMKRCVMNPALIESMRMAAQVSSAPFRDVSGWLEKYEHFFDSLIQKRT